MEKEKKISRITARTSETLRMALQELADRDRNRPLGSYIVNVLEDHVIENFSLLSEEVQERLSQDPAVQSILESKKNK